MIDKKNKTFSIEGVEIKKSGHSNVIVIPSFFCKGYNIHVGKMVNITIEVTDGKK